MRRSILIAAVVLFALVELVPRFVFRTEVLEKRLSAALAECTDGLYRVDLGTAQFSLLGRTLSARDVQFGPDPALLEERKKDGKSPQTICSATAPSIHIDGLDAFAMLRGDVNAASITVTEPHFEIYRNRQVPIPTPRPPAHMPHTRLQEMPQRLRIDELVVKRGSVLYGEKAGDGARPGTIPFEEVEAVFRDITNDPKIHAKGPCTADLRFLLAAKGPMTLSLRYDLGAQELNLDYDGTVGRMDALALNPLLVDMQGIRAKGGVLDSCWYNFEVRDGIAKGKVQLLYHDLDCEVLDKVTRDGGLMEDAKTFLSGLKIHGSNPRDEQEAAVTIPIHRKRTPEASFIRFVWENLRTGVYETLGI